jgi:hypothetical protein
MRVFRLADGTSWVARPVEGEEMDQPGGSGWSMIVFEESPPTSAQRLVYRPPGWLDQATLPDLVAALEEGVSVRLRWAP